MKVENKTISHEVLTQFACDVLAKPECLRKTH